MWPSETGLSGGLKFPTLDPATAAAAIAAAGPPVAPGLAPAVLSPAFALGPPTLPAAPLQQPAMAAPPPPAAAAATAAAAVGGAVAVTRGVAVPARRACADKPWGSCAERGLPLTRGLCGCRGCPPWRAGPVGTGGGQPVSPPGGAPATAAGLPRPFGLPAETGLPALPEVTWLVGDDKVRSGSGDSWLAQELTAAEPRGDDGVLVLQVPSLDRTDFRGWSKGEPTCGLPTWVGVCWFSFNRLRAFMESKDNGSGR